MQNLPLGSHSIVMCVLKKKIKKILEIISLLCLVLQYASEEAELLLVGNKMDCESDRVISRQQGERVSV